MISNVFVSRSKSLTVLIRDGKEEISCDFSNNIYRAKNKKEETLLRQHSGYHSMFFSVSDPGISSLFNNAPNETQMQKIRNLIDGMTYSEIERLNQRFAELEETEKQYSSTINETDVQSDGSPQIVVKDVPGEQTKSKPKLPVKQVPKRRGRPPKKG
jgi:DNA repair exonuclease SbcCD ATPase subunit